MHITELSGTWHNQHGSVIELEVSPQVPVEQVSSSSKFGMLMPCWRKRPGPPSPAVLLIVLFVVLGMQKVDTLKTLVASPPPVA